MDFSKYSLAVTTVRNLYINYRGGAYSRAGTEYILRSLTYAAPGIAPPRIITYQYSVTQGFILELGATYMRFFTNGAAVVEAPLNISGITQSAPGIIEVPGADAAGWTTGDWIFLYDIQGMVPLNNRYFIIGPLGSDQFRLLTLDGVNGVNTSGFPAYIAGGAAAKVYVLSTPWAGNDVALLKFTQSADVMSFVHPDYPPYDLARISDNNWTLTQTDFDSQQTPPGGLLSSPTNFPTQSTSPTVQPCAYAYVVTAVNAKGQESIASARTNITSGVDMAITAGSNIIEWAPTEDAVQYNIYRAPTSYNTGGNNVFANPVPIGAIFSFVGSTFGTEFVDSNIVADSSVTPPTHLDPFAPGQVIAVQVTNGGSGYTVGGFVVESVNGTGASFDGILIAGVLQAIIIKDAGENYQPGDQLIISGDGQGATGVVTIGPTTGTYPSAAAYFQQRRVYANSLNQPDTYWMSKPGLFTNFDVSPISQATDSITGTPWGQQVNGIQWMLQVSGVLLVMTGGGLWQVTGTGGSLLNPQPVTPSSQQALSQNFSGISPLVQPIQIQNEILFVDVLGSVIWSAVYSYFSNNFPTTDQTVLSSHLFQGFDISQWAYCVRPNRVIWAIRCDGVLLSFTYVKEQEVFGWARHDTAGQFVSVASVTEPPVDALYVVAQRKWGGGQAYVIERMDNRIWETAEQPWCVDAGLQNEMLTPDVPISASSTSGPVTFTSSVQVFPSSSVGSVLRIAGGIAQITSMFNAEQISGYWILPPSQLVS